jgi:hypothetical protein
MQILYKPNSEALTQHVGCEVAIHGVRGTLRGAWVDTGLPRSTRYLQLAVSTADGLVTLTGEQADRVVVHGQS